MSNPFEDYMTSALRELRFGPDEIRTYQNSGGYQELQEPVIGPIKIGGYLPVSHEALCDYTTHVCTDECPPKWTPPPVPLRRRVRAALRRTWYFMTGLRVVHKSRIRDDDYDD